MNKTILRSLLGALTAFGKVTSVLAATLAGGPLMNANATQLYCMFVNVGTSAITITKRNIISSDGTIPNVSSNCPGALPAGETCFVYASNLNSGTAYSCQLTFSTGVTYLRGVLEELDAGGVNVGQIELR